MPTFAESSVPVDSTAWKVAKEGFDKASWRLVVNTDPVLTFALGEGDGKAH